jgi:hypothetical protein
MRRRAASKPGPTAGYSGSSGGADCFPGSWYNSSDYGPTFLRSSVEVDRCRAPFPGWTRISKAHWRDIHTRLVIYPSDALQSVLPSALRARVEENVLLETPTGIAFYQPNPDVGVVEYPAKPGFEARTGVPLNLQALVEQCYRNGGYDGTLNYAIDPDPPLLGEDEEWAAQHLHERGLRPHAKPLRRKRKPKSR